VAWHENGIPTITREKRWLELYSKHDEAWKGVDGRNLCGPPRKFGLHDQTKRFFRENQRMGLNPPGISRDKGLSQRGVNLRV
jgi:hypothetical protein